MVIIPCLQGWDRIGKEWMERTYLGHADTPRREDERGKSGFVEFHVLAARSVEGFFCVCLTEPPMDGRVARSRLDANLI